MAQTLQTNIVINAKVGNGFTEVGETLTMLGSMVNSISQDIIGYGKESVKVYGTYEENMTQAEIALAARENQTASDLSDGMKKLEAMAQEMATSSRFGFEDVSNSVMEAARAGWSFEEILNGIPNAAELATAGAIDLSDAINYVVKAQRANGMEYEDIGTFIDHWAFAANTSATNIDEMGDAMMRMGKTMQFAGSTDAVLVMLSELANVGTVGSTAGTMLRSSMLRLIAPTDKAKNAMAELGLEGEELTEVYDELSMAAGDEALTEAVTKLSDAGFSAYDSNGKLKPMLETYRDLGSALADIAGGWDEIDQNQDAIDIISAIFPQRSLASAMALIDAANEDYHGLLDSFENGSAEGYGEYAADQMMGTLNGQIDLFENRLDTLKLRIGEWLKDPLTDAMDALGGIAESASEMDPVAFESLATVGMALAMAGPGLLMAGAGFRMIGAAQGVIANLGALGPVLGGIALSAVGIVVAANALAKIEEIDFAGKFGELELDPSEISEYLDTISADFDDAFGKVEKYRNGLNEAVGQYESLGKDFKQKIITNMLENKQLTKEDMAELTELGKSISEQLLSAIDDNFAADTEALTLAFGGAEEAAANPVWEEIMEILEIGHGAAVDRARELGKELRDALFESFKDGKMSGEELASIQSIMDQQNELLARQQSVDNYVELQKALRKAQTLGLEGILEGAEIVREQFDAELEQSWDAFNGSYKETELAYKYAIKHQIPLESTGAVPTEAGMEYALGVLKEQQDREITTLTAGYEDYLLDLFTEGFRESDLGGLLEPLSALAASYREAGGVTPEWAARDFGLAVQDKPGDIEEALDYFSTIAVPMLGGREEIQKYRDYYAGQGDKERAEQYSAILDISDLLEAYVSGSSASARQDNSFFGKDAYSTMRALLGTDSEQGGRAPEELWATNTPANPADWEAFFGQNYGSVIQSGRNIFGMENASDQAVIAEWVSQIESQHPEIKVGVVLDESSVDPSAMPDLDPIPVPIEPYSEGDGGSMDALAEQGVDVQVNGDTTQLTATIEAADGQNLMTYVDGDATNLEYSITSQDGQTLVEWVTGDASSLQAAIDSCRGQVITVTIVGEKVGFASGGRATTASIFGEAGPEWAIPEEHTQRTADLLNSARAASGFSWQELLSMYGGMNANPDNKPSTIIYSPTINAADARGVEQVLADDKKRFEKWWSDKMMREEVEVYA